MDNASLYDNSTNQYVYTANYTSVLTNNLFVEGQWSKKISATMDTGSRFTDLVRGTPISDAENRHRESLFNSPTFCASAAAAGWKHRGQLGLFREGQLLLSTNRTGAHNLVAGFDNFKEWRMNDECRCGHTGTSSSRRSRVRRGRSLTGCPDCTRRSSAIPEVVEAGNEVVRTGPVRRQEVADLREIVPVCRDAPASRRRRRGRKAAN